MRNGPKMLKIGLKNGLNNLKIGLNSQVRKLVARGIREDVIDGESVLEERYKFVDCGESSGSSFFYSPIFVFRMGWAIGGLISIFVFFSLVGFLVKGIK